MSHEVTGFKKVLNRKEIFALAFGAMIGWSWVVLSGDWIKQAGTLGAIIAFIMGGFLVLFVGLTYAELTVAMPKCGGEHVFSMRAIGVGGSFICTWAIIICYVGVVAFEACAFPTVIQYIAPGFMRGYMYTIAGFDVYASWVAVAVVSAIIITVINYIGIKPAAVFNMVLTFVIAGVGILLVAGSAVSGSMETTEPFFDNGFKGILSVAVMTPFMFVGFDVIPQAAEEINIPYKKIGGILMLSIAMAIVFYMAMIFAVSRVMTRADLDAASLATADAMKKALFNSDAAAKVLIIGGMAGIITSWNAFFVGGSRAIYAMAEAKMLPGFLGKLHPRYKTPVTAIVLIGTVSMIAPFFGRRMLVWLVDAGSAAAVVAYLLVAVSFLILRKNEPDMERPYRVRFGVFAGIMAVALSIFMAILYIPGMPSGLVPQELFILGIWVLAGIACGITAKMKYGAQFGHAEGLLHPVKYREKNKAAA
ncbi:MAG: APC family permease [Treponema sp.]|jgi:amino acid transporter|nr:APC family permease [Treponema sp.]